MNVQKISHYLGTETMFGIDKLCFLPKTSSTNDFAKELGAKGAPEGTVVLADYQAQGRGRRGRQWSAPQGMNIAMSLLLRPKILPTKASMLTLVAAMAVMEGLQRLGIETQIKWPNDIVVDGRKLCGILTEMSAQMSGVNYVVTGIGMNVHQSVFPEELKTLAVSLDMLAGRRMQRSEVIAEVLKAYEKYYRLFLETEDLSLLAENYNRHLVSLGREVQLIENSGIRRGISGGIDKDGCLLVTIGGVQEKIMSGEVSVRGIYGYV